MSCHDEHDHHDHGGHDHGHGHSHTPPPDTNASQSLYQHIYHDNIRTLNEAEPNSGKLVFKKWEDRLDTTDTVESDVDEQLLFFVPFTGLVRLHSLLIRTTTDDRAPNTIKLFKNRDDLDFSTVADLQATAKFEHPFGVGGSEDEDPEQVTEEGIVEYALNRAHFSNVTSLAIFIEDNHGADISKILYIGLRGEWTKLNRAPVVTLYESAANPADHKNLVPDPSLSGSLGQ
uniref:ARAD1A17974p n=1 Tax=Blastobotrys adeninivorans TaxID=409370 RepID=A0A060T4I9_BLAAD